MEKLRENPILEFPPDLLTSVRKLYNLDQPGRMSEAVDILEEWVKKQEHFTKKDFSRSYLETTIITSKGSLERAKSRMDKLCTFRTMWPKLFEITNVKEEMASIMDYFWFVFLPKLTNDNYRVVIMKPRSSAFQPSDYVKFINLNLIALEYQKRFDYAVGDIIVYDYMDINVTDVVSKMGLTELQQCIMVTSHGYGVRIKGIIFLTPSKLIDGFIKVIKQFLPEKVGNRLQVYKSVDDLCEFVPKESLPSEYGGTAKSMGELHDQCMDAFSSEDHVKFLKDIKNARTDESLRKNDKHNDDTMGMPGTFRTLSLD